MALNRLYNETNILSRVASDDKKASAEWFYTYCNPISAFVLRLMQDPSVSSEDLILIYLHPNRLLNPYIRTNNWTNRYICKLS